jgi:hypothetical protein
MAQQSLNGTYDVALKIALYEAGGEGVIYETFRSIHCDALAVSCLVIAGMYLVGKLFVIHNAPPKYIFIDYITNHRVFSSLRPYLCGKLCGLLTAVAKSNRKLSYFDQFRQILKKM